MSAIIPLTGTDVQRISTAAAGYIYPNEIHTTNQQRLFKDNVLISSVWLGNVANAGAMTNLNHSSARGCFPMDMCYRLDLREVFVCITNRGQSGSDWMALGGTGGFTSNSSGGLSLFAINVEYVAPSSSTRLVSTNVQDAIDELERMIDALEDAPSGGGGGTGDVVGPTGATDNALARFNTGTGKLLQNSLVTVDDSGGISTASASTFTTPAGGYPTPLLVQSDGSSGNVLQLNNLHTGGSNTKKSQISFSSLGTLTWALGTDANENGGDDFFIYQNSRSDFSFQIKNDGKLRLKAYVAGYLQTDASGNVTAGAGTGGGTGDVVGPSGATDNAITRFDLATGKILQDSLVIVDDTGILTTPTGIYANYLVAQTPVGTGFATFDWVSPSHHYTWALSGASTSSPDLFYLYDQNATAIRFQIETNGLVTMNKGYLHVGDGGTAGSLIQINSATYAILQYNRLSVTAFSTGTSYTPDDFILGSVQDDMNFKSDQSKNINFSTDNGSNMAFQVVAANGGAKFGSALWSGGTLPGSTSFYIERSSYAIATLKSTGADARFRLIRADNTKSAWCEFIRADDGTKWEFGAAWNGATSSGNSFAMVYYDGSAEHLWLELKDTGDLSLPGIALTTGLSITTATKTFPLTIGGTVVNVLCQ